MRVLVTGGSGYLGQFLVLGLTARGHTVAFTYCSADPRLPVGTAHRVNLATGEGLAACLAACGPLDAVINAAAVSQPAACERDPAAAAALNVPTALLDALRDVAPAALLIHVSTDHVYDGTRPFWTEDDAACTPVNVYGTTKLAAENAVRVRWPRHAILRCSAIVGPRPHAPVSRTLFLQWLDAALAAAPVELFEDEFRNPVFVDDIVEICAQLLMHNNTHEPLPLRTFNVGGPERLSRADMGDAVCAVRCHPRAHVRRVPAASVPRPVASPADISMDVSRVQVSLGVRLTPFAEAVQRSFAPADAAV